MKAAEHGCDQRRGQQKRQIHAVGLDEIGERVARRALPVCFQSHARRPCSAPRGEQSCRAGGGRGGLTAGHSAGRHSLEGDRGLERLRRTVQHIGRVVGQLQAAVARGNGTASQRHAAAAERDNLFPSGAAGEIVVAVVERHGPGANSVLQTRPVNKTHLHRRQPAGARRKNCLARNAFKRERVPVSVERQAAFQAISLPHEIWRKGRIAALGNQPAVYCFLEGRNFSHIDYVVELDGARSGNDLRIVIDAEVAHRMRVGDARNHDCRAYSDQRH